MNAMNVPCENDCKILRTFILDRRLINSSALVVEYLISILKYCAKHNEEFTIFGAIHRIKNLIT